MNREGHYAFYGTLRRGGENYPAYHQDMVYLRTVVLSGFRMYSLGEYPYIVRTGNSVDKIVADLFRVTRYETEEIIHEMEVKAGYVFSEVEIDDIKFGIYLFEHADERNFVLETGNWSVFRKLSGF